ncbi:hypothetical protein ACOMICROBIO_FLGHMIGD_00357 [Vibrio sp. B1FLJ16]|nr:hypothetical protein ACOMICROBIO_FLGHMIGD_00357 [Vibrio sp. B1FLJ16]CAE6883058.1 hypothetical protein ACOMICROBIO_FLGHMIGD_00357 [Vibrio sp. B1FLJ16]
MFKGNNKSRDNIAYWMLADTELPIAKEKSFENSFEAHFKHGLLFNEKIMISDAQAVNCVNLRNLIRKKKQLQRTNNTRFTLNSC